MAFYVLLNCLGFGNFCFGLRLDLISADDALELIYYIAQAGLKLIAILLPLEYLEYRCEPPYCALNFTF